MGKSNMTTMHERDMRQRSSNQKFGTVLGKTGTYLFLFIMALIVLFPFYWMIISSLKTLEEYRRNVPTFFPQTMTPRPGSSELKASNSVWDSSWISARALASTPPWSRKHL